MDSMVQYDVQKLTNDIEEVRQVLELLENDRFLWARTREEKDISDLIDCISKIEVDLSVSMNNLIANNNSSKNEGFVIEKMQHAFSYVNDLFHDVKNIKNELESFYIQADELETLEIDWARFRKNIFQVMNYMQDECSEKSNQVN